MGCQQYMVTTSFDPCHHDSPEVCPWHPATKCVVTNATAPSSKLSTRQCSSSHCKGVIRLSPHCYYPSPDLSPIEPIWYRLGRRVGHPMSLNELEARLQQIWNEMSQGIIQNLYASMPDRIVSCIRAIGDSPRYDIIRSFAFLSEINYPFFFDFLIIYLY
ncbi:UNVERIFIED_CONTAM: hypothetical protein NCL1_48313 [Trichonephila clavipes]